MLVYDGKNEIARSVLSGKVQMVAKVANEGHTVTVAMINARETHVLSRSLRGSHREQEMRSAVARTVPFACP